ncbi:conserved hypothetical protein [Pediculus humanus corporis]|uniref:Post-GPI attachment to proteins factor 3 n=1 Tax=Pediculus humanus subsp. corporis TaxID=121224 RepID=E0VVQ8_PEDHC|nr:uncharacterized protein Phum_PHUM467000 [Pediculus humanus corporis]EEB17464.1 conserved hypothetical protein [Pediculus humanus corporis]
MLLLSCILFLFEDVLGSIGDNSFFYINCVQYCDYKFCHSGKQKVHHRALKNFEYSLWSCIENCEYECQWKTVESFQKRNWPIPQFRGKWPFIRLFGFQEPASVFFSVLNFITVLKLILLFRKKVSNSAPYYYIWNLFGLIQLNSWFWSTVYHTRDVDFTEKMDYISAFILIIYSFYAMGLRYISPSINKKTLLWSIFCGLFGLNHVSYLWLYNFDYGWSNRSRVVSMEFSSFSITILCLENFYVCSSSRSNYFTRAYGFSSHFMVVRCARPLARYINYLQYIFFSFCHR